jgi:hypothetical protein
MNYDLLLTDVGADELSVAFAVMNSIQQLVPLAVLDVNKARDWLAHPPILLRRGIAGAEARDMQQRYEQIGAAVAIMPSALFFPLRTKGITRWRNEWFSEHLLALHERVFADWAKDNKAEEAYRFSFLPSLGTDMTMRLWTKGQEIHALARRSIGNIGPFPGPPVQEAVWQPSREQWQTVRDAMQTHHFWESKTWDTVPKGYTIIDTTHWVMEGWRSKHYKALFDQTPNEGAAREVGLLLLDLLPDDFDKPEIE